jgi:hypothetical protein
MVGLWNGAMLWIKEVTAANPQAGSALDTSCQQSPEASVLSVIPENRGWQGIRTRLEKASATLELATLEHNAEQSCTIGSRCYTA